METRIISISGDKSAADRSFGAFLKSAGGQAACGEELIARLMPSADTITSQNMLLKWSKERHPDQFGVMEWRGPLPVSAAPYGSTAMKSIWAKYLAWKESL